MFERPVDGYRHRAMHGLVRSLVANMVDGVNTGFTKHLELVGVGYRVAKQGDELVLNLGYSHPIRFKPPAGHHHRGPGPDQVLGHRDLDRRRVGQVAANIRRFRPPEPYKGKGVMYRGEKVRRKARQGGQGRQGERMIKRHRPQGRAGRSATTACACTWSGRHERPRLAVFRSLNHVYAQLIDDGESRTLAAVSTVEMKAKGNGSRGGGRGRQGDRRQGQGGRGQSVVFDRGGFLYHGRIKALADAAREAGLEF